jgi:hypothetical protein
MTKEELAEWEGCQEIAEEVVSAFADLFPKLALPRGVWDVLVEMIQRECIGHLGQKVSVGVGAIQLSQDELYIAKAVASGLR